MPTKVPSRNVCIVDDDASVRTGLCRLMKSAGLAARAFGSASEFLQARSGPSHGCLVLDVLMPGMGGFELQEKLKSQGPALPVIFITALHDQGTRDRAMANGAHAFFEKPFDADRLLRSVRAALAGAVSAGVAPRPGLRNGRGRKGAAAVGTGGAGRHAQDP
jgi:two-component system response regulator FixJ